MPAIDGIKIYGESNAFCDKLKLNHATAREKVGEIADGECGLVGDGLQQLVGVITPGCVDEENGASGFILCAFYMPHIERSAADAFVGNDLFQTRAE